MDSNLPWVTDMLEKSLINYRRATKITVNGPTDKGSENGEK